MASYLKHLKTGEIYPFNPDLARHPMMQPHEPVPAGFEEPAEPAKPKAKRKPRKAAAKKPAAPAKPVEPEMESADTDGADDVSDDEGTFDLDGLDIE